MDVLSKIMEARVDGCFMSRFLVGGFWNDSINVPHLLLANDNFFFCK